MLSESIASCVPSQEPDIDQKKRARHREVARRYAWAAKQRCDTGCEPFALLRLSELERLFMWRWGGRLPDDDAGHDDLIVAAHHIWAFNPSLAPDRIRCWATVWAPWAHADEIVATVAARPRRFTADTLGWRMQLSDADRSALQITTIGAFDVSKAQRKKRRRTKNRIGERERRRKAGATPRSMSAARTKPWQALGISRRTYYYRRRQEGCTNPCTPDFYGSGVHETVQLIAEPMIGGR